MIDLFDYLKEKTYPGRGIVIGTSRNGKNAVIAYFIMGRSENSRNRLFVPLDEGLRTIAKDPLKMTDPSLIIYTPVRIMGNITIVTNGDQTDTIYKDMSEGKTFCEALTRRSFEPDAPNFTPRISGIHIRRNTDSLYWLSILKTSKGNPKACERFYYQYESSPGLGHLIHTYESNADPLPSFKGEPISVAMDVEDHDELKKYANKFFKSLYPDNRISLFVRLISLKSGDYTTEIINDD